MDADHQKSAFASKRGVPKCPFGELYVLHFQTDDFFKTKSCGKQEKYDEKKKPAPANRKNPQTTTTDNDLSFASLDDKYPRLDFNQLG